MKEKLSNKVLLRIFQILNVLFIIVFCIVFSDAIVTVYPSATTKATIYAIIGGLYIGAYGAMTSQLWIKSLEDKE